jgi:pimeloyl-ACP methyl ester carboxylesterase
MPVAAMLLMVGCGSSGNGAVPTTRATPVAVHVAAEPNTGETLGDPAFDALPGATAHFGRLGGSIYQIEIPKNWNRRLVLYMHGQSGKFEPVLNVEMPPNRRDLINQGYAWAASSFSRGDFEYGTGADETTALWDHFVEDLGLPEHTYVFGGSAGGASALISASRYGDRIDGILAACPAPGTRPDIDYIGDTVVAALYAAGVSQDQFHPGDARAFVANSLLPSLNDPVVHRRFVDTWIQLTGGARPYAEEGLNLQENYLLAFGAKLIAYGTIDNTGEVYRASDGSNALSDLHPVVIQFVPEPSHARSPYSHEVARAGEDAIGRCARSS